MPITIDGRDLPASQVFEYEGEYYDNEKWALSHISNRPIRKVMAIPDIDGNYYTPEEYIHHFSSCNHCLGEVPIADVVTVEDRRYCEACANSMIDYCASCDGLLSTTNAMEARNQYWHRSCYRAVFAECNNCYEPIHVVEDAFELSQGLYFCGCCEILHETWEPKPFTIPSTFDEIPERKFGIELETSDCPEYRNLHNYFDHFGAGFDASVRGMEFISAPLYGDRGLDEARLFCKELMRRDYQFDSHCGFHVHVDVGDLNEKQLVRVCAAFQLTYDVWCCFVPDSRIRNRFCLANDWDYKDMVWIESVTEFRDQYSYRGNRQQWFNIDAYNRHKTFENRLHTATLSHKKVANWAKANVKFIEAVKDIHYVDLERMFSGSLQSRFNHMVDLWDDTDLGNFYAFRSRKFGKALSNHRPQPRTIEQIA